MAPQGNYQALEAPVRTLLLRHPYRYLAAHWALTGALAAALLLPHSPAGAPGSRAITLLTGQAVRLDAAGIPLPTPGLREGHLFGSDFYAVPTAIDDAAVGAPFDQAISRPYGATPAQPVMYDPVLFDLSYQTANGFDDAVSGRIPLIVRFSTQEAARAAMARGAVDGGIHLTHLFEYVPDAMGYVDKHGPFALSHPDPAEGIVAIALDAREQASPDTVAPVAPSEAAAAPLLNDALPLIGADVARARGLTGRGITIAVVDTGIDANHPDFQGRIVAARDFSSDNDTTDHFGHGTHVAGIAAGTGALSDGKYGGVAPGAQLISAKALSKNGSGSMSGIMRAMEWAADQGARIENLSLGGPASDGRDALSQEVNAITARKGVLFVIAAGNSGPRGRVSTPAAADSALAVAAVDKSRALAPFSSRGPRIRDLAVKPDIAAPGVRITAPRANYGDQDPYATYSGTSMATPMVAGAAALVMQLHPDWTALQVKNALMNGASPIGDGDSGYVSVYDQGAGLVDLRNMVDQRVLIQPANLSFGVISGKDQRQLNITIRNLTDQRLVVDLAGDLRRVDGTGAAQVELSAPQATLPARGEITVRLTARGGDTKGTFSGNLIAQVQGTAVARAAVGVTLR